MLLTHSSAIRKFAVLVSTALAAACGGGDNGQADPDADAGDPHDCTPYETQPISETFADDWSDSDDNRDNLDRLYPHVFASPDEPGGGWIDLDLSVTSATSASFSSRLRVQIGEQEVAVSDGGSETDARLRFFAAPGQTFEIAPVQFLADPVAGNYPIQYELTATYTGAVDCYEPNRERSDARRIPFGQTLEAFMTAGLDDTHTTAAAPSNEEHDDWFLLVLDEPAEVSVVVESLPSNLELQVRLWPEGGTSAVLSAQNAADPGASFSTDTVLLSPGTYELQMNPWLVPPVRTTDLGDDVPDHWLSPYRFRVTRD